MCQPASLKHKPEGLGEVVDGNRQIASPYAIAFKTDVVDAKLCTRVLTPEDVARLRSAVLVRERESKKKGWGAHKKKRGQTQ